MTSDVDAVLQFLKKSKMFVPSAADTESYYSLAVILGSERTNGLLVRHSEYNGVKQRSALCD